MDHQLSPGPVSDLSGVAQGVGEGEELAPEPGTVGELVHFDGSVTRIDGGGRCVLGQVAAHDDSPHIVVRLLEGRTWNHAVPAPAGPSRYELRVSGAVVTARDATFTAVRRGDGSCLISVLDGQVDVRAGAGSLPVPVGPFQTVTVSGGGDLGLVRNLTPGEVVRDSWLEANRAFDADEPAGPEAPAPLTASAPPSLPPPGEGDAAVADGAPFPERGSVAVAAPPEAAPTALPLIEPTAATAPAPQETTVAGPPAMDQDALQAQAPAPAPPPFPSALEPPRRARVPRLGELRRSQRGVLAGVAVAVVAAVLMLAYRQPPTITVVVSGTEVRVTRSRATVATALRAADVEPRTGALRSVVTQKVLDPEFVPARLLVDGRPATAETKLQAGDRVEVEPGRDVTEATARREAESPPPDLPDVEHDLWYPGANGREEQVYGVTSGEIVSRTVIVPPVPPRRETGNVVALTFDDGPHPQWTPQILDILRAEGVKATFCVVGSMGERRPDLVRAARDQGHTMCNHTASHARHLDVAPTRKVVDEIDDGYRFLESTLGSPPPLFRPPGGRVSPLVIDVAHEREMRVVNWNVDSRDYDKPPAALMLEQLLAAIRPGAVVLMHDGGGDRSQTVALLPMLIHELKARGFAFATPTTPPPG